MSQYDLASLHDFLLHTPEQGLRKMLIDPKSFTDAHLNLLLKVVRNSDLTQFSEHFEKTSFPKIKMGPAEMKLKEKFWPDLITVLKSRGLLNPATNQKTAA